MESIVPHTLSVKNVQENCRDSHVELLREFSSKEN